MKRILKWLGAGLAALVVLALGAAGYVYVVSERIARRTYELPLASFAAPTDVALAAEGQRLARLRGCYDGCHGEGFSGGVFIDEPMLARLVAPDLTRIAALHSDAELERAIRHGVRLNGQSTMAMPSSMFYHLSDADLGAIIAFIRSTPLTDGPATAVDFGPLARIGLVSGKFVPQAEEIDHAAPRLVADPADSLAFGRYLATTVCTECHGMDFGGEADDSIPNLAIATSYPEADFTELMRTGVALGGRELGLMADVARSRFAYFTDAEIQALHAFLRTLGGAAAASEDPS